MNKALKNLRSPFDKLRANRTHIKSFEGFPFMLSPSASAGQAPSKHVTVFSAFGFFLALLLMSAVAANAQDKDQGTVVVQALGDAGKQSDTKVQIYAEGTQVPAATAKLGSPVNLPPGTYRLEVEVLGGKVSRDKILVKAGRTSTVIISEVAGLRVNVLDKKGNDLGLTVEVYDSVSGQKLGDFLSGETIFAYPGVVDVKVGVPPQSQWWRKVELQSGVMAGLELKERVQGELRVRPQLDGRDVSSSTQVIIYEAGTQKEVARSEPGREHRFALDAGAYDIFVANATGQGKPFVTEPAEVKGEETVEKDVPLDADGQPATPAAPAAPSKTLSL